MRYLPKKFKQISVSHVSPHSRIDFILIKPFLIGFLVMSLVEDSQAGSSVCTGVHCGDKHGHHGDIGKDSPIFDDAIKFLKKVEEQW